MKIKRFAQSEIKYINNYPDENQKKEYWVEYEDGTKKFVDDDTIQGLWWEWVKRTKTDNYKENGFTVFDINY